MSTDAAYEALPGSLGEGLLKVDRALYDLVHQRFDDSEITEDFVLPIRSGELAGSA